MRRITRNGVLPATIALVGAIILIGLSADRDEGRLDTGGRGHFYEPSNHPARAQEAGKAANSEAEGAIKSSLGPHTIDLETSLRSARARVTGLKAGVGLLSNRPTEKLEVVRSIRDQLNQDLGQAESQNQVMRENATGSFTELAASQRFLDAENAMNSLKQSHQEWQAKAAGDQYWKDEVQVAKDLDALKGQIDSAIDKAGKFSSESLGITSSGG